MPPIEYYGCTDCDFSLPTGWGGYMYAVDDHGKRQVCPHPLEFETVFRVTGLSFSDADAVGRIGHIEHCVCLTCLAQFDLDTERDELVCEKCSSANVITANDLVGKPCPSCSKGTIERSSPIRWKLDVDWESLPVPNVVKDLVVYHNTRQLPDSLTNAQVVADKHGAHNFSTVACRLLQWWEGDYFGATEEEMDQQDSAEMNPQWTWCKALPDVLNSTPALASLVSIGKKSCSFPPSVTTEERGGIKNYLRKHLVHSMWS